ncbi:MAG: hypothetical protein FOGNACKC_03097 [Anaerolineae bacterium]|nr:hypothetical protein [Anaerolineae bacterium]
MIAQFLPQMAAALRPLKQYLRLIILPVLLLALALRLFQLDAQSLRGDEAATVLYSALPLSELWELARITDPHPPLYYALLHPWQAALGDGAWVMRFAGVLTSVLAVAALYRLANLTLRSVALSLLAALLLAVNPLQIWLAQDIRAYSLFTLLGLLSSWALWAALTKQIPDSRLQIPEHNSPLATRHSLPATRNPKSKMPGTAGQTLQNQKFIPWLIYVLLTVASLYTHYYTIFLIAFQGLFVLVNAKKFWAEKWPWLVAQLAIGLAIIPGLSLAYGFAGGEAGGGVAVIPLPEILQRAASALLTGFTLNSGWADALSLLLLPVWVAGAVALVRKKFTAGTFWLLFFAAPTLGVVVMSIDRPFFKERFLIQAQPAFLLLLAVGILSILELRITHYALRITHYALRIFAFLTLAMLLLANVIAIANYHTDPAYAKAPPWRLYHDYVQSKAQPGDVMLTNFPEASVSYYSPDGLPFYVVPAERDLSAAQLIEQTGQIASAYRRIWFLPLLNQGFDEHGEVLNWLDRHTDRIDQIFFPTYNLNLYLSPAAIDEQIIAQPAQFGHGIHLRGFQVLDKRGQSRLTPQADGSYLLTLKPEDRFTLSLYWQAGRPPAEPYTVFVHLVAADGFVRTSQDNPPVWGTYPVTDWSPGEQVVDKYTLVLPPGTPPGDHHLRLGWYQSASGQRAPLLSPPVAVDDFTLPVTVRVEPD